jgi:hypothetical protein
MAFVLKGEVEIDGRKAAITLRGVQQEATKTANTFKQSDAHAQKLGKTLVGLGLHAGKAGSAFGLLAKLGTGGIFGYAVLGSMNKFGDAVKQASTDYYSAQKDLADAFETSFKSTSVDQARAGVEKTQDTIESLRGKITQLGPMQGILKGIEQFTGINLGAGDAERTLKQSQDQLVVQEEMLKVKQKEKEQADKIEKQTRNQISASKTAQESLKYVKETEGGKEILVDLAKEELKQALALRDENSKILDTLIQTNREGNNKEQINARTLKLAELELDVYKSQNNVVKAGISEQAAKSKQAQQASGGLLGASMGGQQALDVARKQRTRQLKGEDFKAQEKVFGSMRDAENKKRAAQGLPPVTTQDMRVQVAKQQAAGEMPSLANKLQAGAGGGSAEQLAREGVGGGKGGKDTTETLIKAVQALVDTMKSGTVVK